MPGIHPGGHFNFRLHSSISGLAACKEMLGAVCCYNLLTIKAPLPLRACQLQEHSHYLPAPQMFVSLLAWLLSQPQIRGKVQGSPAKKHQQSSFIVRNTPGMDLKGAVKKFSRFRMTFTGQLHLSKSTPSMQKYTHLNEPMPVPRHSDLI